MPLIQPLTKKASGGSFSGFKKDKLYDIFISQKKNPNFISPAPFERFFFCLCVVCVVGCFVEGGCFES